MEAEAPHRGGLQQPVAWHEAVDELMDALEHNLGRLALEALGRRERGHQHGDSLPPVRTIHGDGVVAEEL